MPRARRPLTSIFAKRLQEMRVGRGLSQTDLANVVGVNQAQISRLEKGDRSTRLETLDRIARALAIDPLELLSDPRTGLVV